MKICVLGTGVVGRTIGAKLAASGHEVMVGTRDVRSTLEQTEPDRMGQPPFSQWHKQNTAVRLGTFAEAAVHGEMVINATNGTGSIPALRQAGESSLAGKVLWDISNPLDFSHGMPPTLWVSNTDSLAEQIQREFPSAKVVKTLNTVTAAVMVDPGRLAGGDHTIFLSGNDPQAKAQTAEWLREWFGWREVVELGDIASARAAEMYLPLWLRLWGSLGTPMFNIRVVR
jgi:predicted dinucleotide-binding enzyme